MAAKKINVLIVDDSLTVRSLIRKTLESENHIQNIYTASNGKIGIDFCHEKKPDVIILDMNMPEKNGLDVVKELRAQGSQTPIVLFSTSTQAPETMEALKFKDVDFLAKDDSNNANFGTGLDKHIQSLKVRILPKIYQFFDFKKELPRDSNISTENSSLTSTKPTSSFNSTPSHHLKIAPLPQIKNELPQSIRQRFKSPLNPRPDAIVIASSTGGPRALEQVFKDLHAYASHNFKPIFIVQHMPAGFTSQLATNLSRISGLKFVEAKDNELAQNGHIYIAPGGYHMELRSDPDSTIKIIIHQKPMRHSVMPAAEYLFESAAPIYKHKLLGVVLTGMGEDGIDGCRALKKQFAKVVTQTAETCAVYGMPKAIDDAGLSDGSENLEDIRSILIENHFRP